MSAHGQSRGAMVIIIALTGVLSSCSSDAADGKKSGKSCEGLLRAADPAAKLPRGIPSLVDQVLYDSDVQGKTTVVFGRLAGDDFVKVRDDLVDKLKAAGWRIDGTDQESVEAEAQFSMSPPLKAGTIKVQPLCRGYMSVRYRLSE